MADPITISALVTYLATKLKDNKDFKEFTTDFTQASINWIRSILLKPDNTPKDVMASLKEKPDSEARKNALAAAIATEIEDNSQSIKYLKEIDSVIKSKQIQQQTSVIDSKNVNTGTVSAGGNISFGDSTLGSSK